MSGRIEKGDIISEEALNDIAEYRKELENILAITKKIKEIGIEIKCFSRKD